MRHPGVSVACKAKRPDRPPTKSLAQQPAGL